MINLPYMCFEKERQTRGHFTLIVRYEFHSLLNEDTTVTAKCRTAIKVLLLYLKKSLEIPMG